MNLLTKTEIKKQLDQLPDWSYQNNKLCITYLFEDFDQTLKAINLVGDLAVQLNHHPDWCNSYTQLNISIMTKDLGGVSDLDFKFATRTQALLKEFIL